MGRRSWTALAPLGLAVSLFCACGGSEPEPVTPAADNRPAMTTVELAAFEVRSDEIDRFEHCPPAGEIGQDWVPPLPDWHPPAASTSAAVPESAVDGPGDESPGTPAPDDADRPVTLHALTDEAIAATRLAFRRCYHAGLLADPTQDGHVAVVLRVGRTGRVASAETWGACDIAPQAIQCMREEGSRLKLHPPLGGSATVTVPAVFTNGAEHRTTPNDAYAAAAYVAIEASRARLHKCEQAQRQAGKSVFASATMAIDVDRKGHGEHVAVDPWQGDTGLLGCAAETLRDATYPPPPAGRGKIIVPVVFNPRIGSR
jgi:hypothetical protein